MSLYVNPKFLFQKLGDEELVADPEGREVAVLSGTHLKALSSLRSGEDVEQVFPLEVEDLVAMGVVLRQKGLSRRKAIGLGAAAAAASLVSVAMPTAAYASSSIGELLVVSGCYDDGRDPLLVAGAVNLLEIDGFRVRLDNDDVVSQTTGEANQWDSDTGEFLLLLGLPGGVGPSFTKVELAVYRGGANSNYVELAAL